MEPAKVSPARAWGKRILPRRRSLEAYRLTVTWRDALACVAGRRSHVVDQMPHQLALIAASAGLGALIGLIRQWHDQEKHSGAAERDFGGVRTHTFWAVLGCLGAGAHEQAPWAFVAVLLAVTGHLIATRIVA
ncbi:MAG TPA: MgtC/SapB family protein, partial [Candidatus Synoicihabitans sp.]|nr:MgtC/SapB family protein [Candidatus Synoicihabitans sp.]